MAPIAPDDLVTVRRVAGVRDLRRFIDLPYRLHEGTPWVPPLRLERWVFLTRRFNPFFTHGRAEYFLALSGGRVVGRITAQVDDSFNRYHLSRQGAFGFLEFEDDQEIVDALLARAEHWLRAEGCDRMVGPMDFSMNDECGVLIEGFEHAPMLRQSWHPPYYEERCEKAGLVKVMDLYSWHLNTPEDREHVNPILPKLAELARQEHGIELRTMSRRHLRRELDAFAEVYNEAWADNWGFSPFEKADLDAYVMDLQLAHTKGGFVLAERHGETVGMSITLLDLNQVLAQIGGRLLPWGWWHYLRRYHRCDQIRIGFLGVKPRHQHTGAAAAMYMEAYDLTERLGVAHAEAGWILENNTEMNRALEALAFTLWKRYRLYERAL